MELLPTVGPRQIVVAIAARTVDTYCPPCSAWPPPFQALSANNKRRVVHHANGEVVDGGADPKLTQRRLFTD